MSSSAAQITRIQSLVAGLPGPMGNGELFVWVLPGDAADMAVEVFSAIKGADLLPYTPKEPTWVPNDPGGLMRCLGEIGEMAALERMTTLASRTLAYDRPGRYDRAKAAEVFRALSQLLGLGTRWWSNAETDTDLCAWNPVTRHVIDGIVVGAGGGVIVAMLVHDTD